MIVEYFGHDLFRLTLADGTLLVADPYGSFHQYPRRRLRADVCTVSHDHHDHNAVDSLEGSPIILRTAGMHLPRPGLTITGVPTFHDEVHGQKRGPNLAFLIEAEGLRLVHLGDLGHVLTEAQAEILFAPDVLLLPVGGTYTIDAPTARTVMDQLRPKVTIPMHYQTQADLDMPIAPVADFLALLRADPVPMPLLRITEQDISQRPGLLLMTTPEGL